MKHLLITALLLLLTGCNRQPAYRGNSMGSYGNPDQQTTTCVITQRDPQNHLLFVIAWTAERGGGTSTSDSHNLLTAIHDRPIRPSLKRKALYALQPDYSLSEISLSDDDLDALFAAMDTEQFHTTHSELWQKQVAPKLANVEAATGEVGRI